MSPLTGERQYINPEKTVSLIVPGTYHVQAMFAGEINSEEDRYVYFLQPPDYVRGPEISIYTCVFSIKYFETDLSLSEVEQIFLNGLKDTSAATQVHVTIGTEEAIEITVPVNDNPTVWFIRSTFVVKNGKAYEIKQAREFSPIEQEIFSSLQFE